MLLLFCLSHLGSLSSFFSFPFSFSRAKNINKSLSALGNTIRELMKRSTIMAAAQAPNASAAAINAAKEAAESHVPYRDSRLTFLLRDSLGGNSLTFLIACVSPSASAFYESLSTLKFAAMANTIRTNAKINAEQDFAALAQAQHMEQLKRDNEKLKMQVQNMMAAQGLGMRRLSLMPGLGAHATTGSTSATSVSTSSASAYASQAGLFSPSKLLPGSIAENDESAPASAASVAAAAASAEEIFQLQSLLLQSHSRETEWSDEISAYKAEIAMLRRKQSVDIMMMRMREKHIASLQAAASTPAAIEGADALVEENARLTSEIDLLRKSAAITHAPSIVEAHTRIAILQDRLAQLQDSTPVDESDEKKSHRHHVEFALQSSLLALGSKHAALESQYAALLARPAEAVLDSMSPTKRARFTDLELAKFEAEQAFEARIKKVQAELQSEREMVAHLECQLSHALDSAASASREAEETLLLKNGYLLRAENEKAALSRTVAAMEEAAALQNAASLAALGDHRATSEALFARLSQELEAARTRLDQQVAEHAAKDQSLFDVSQRIVVLQHQHEHQSADLKAARKELEESKHQRVQEAAANKTAMETREAEIEAIKTKLATLTAELAASADEASSLRQSLDSAQSDLSAAQTALASRGDEVDSLTFKLESTQEDIDTLNAEFGFQSDQLAQARSALAEAQESLQHTRGELDAEHKVVASKDASISLLKSELEQARSMRTYEAEFLELQSVNATQAGTIEGQAGQIQALQAEIGGVTAKLAATEEARATEEQAKLVAELSVSDLRSALQGHAARLETVSSALEASAASLEASRGDVAALELQLTQAQHRVASVEAELKSRAAQMDAQSSQIEAVTAQLHESAEAKIALKAELSAAQEQGEQQAVEVEALKNALESAKAAESSLQSALASARSEKDALASELSASTQQVQTLSVSKAHLESQLAEIVAMASKLQDGAASHAETAASSAQALAITSAQLEASQAESATLKAQVESLSAELKTVRSKSEARRQEFEAHQAEFGRMMSAFEAAKKSRDDEIASLRTQGLAMESAVAAAKKDASAAAAVIEDLKAESSKLISEREALQTQLRVAQDAAQLASKDSVIALELQAELSALQARHDQVLQRCQSVEAEHAAAAESAAAVTHNLQSELTTMQQRYEQATQRCQALESQQLITAEQASTVASALTSKLSALQAQLDAAALQCQTLESQHQESSRRALALQSELGSLQQSHASLTQRCQSLESQQTSTVESVSGELSSLHEKCEALLAERHAWVAEMESVRSDEARLLSAHGSLSAELLATKDALSALADRHAAATKELAAVTELNVALTGHQNSRQKIQLHQTIKLENDTLKKEKNNLEREVRKFRKLYAATGSGAAALDKDLAQADEHLKQGEQAQQYLRQIMAQIGKIETRVASATAIGKAPLGDITNAAAAASASASVSGASKEDLSVDESFPSCLQSLSSLSAQLVSSHMQLEQLRREISTTRKAERLQELKDKISGRNGNKLTTTMGAVATEEDQENM